MTNNGGSASGEKCYRIFDIRSRAGNRRFPLAMPAD